MSEDRLAKIKAEMGSDPFFTLMRSDVRWLVEEVDQSRTEVALSQEVWTNTKRRVEAIFGPDWDVAQREVFDSGNQGWATIVYVAVDALRTLIRDQVDEINDWQKDNTRLRVALAAAQQQSQLNEIYGRELKHVNGKLRAALAAAQPAPLLVDGEPIACAELDLVTGELVICKPGVPTRTGVDFPPMTMADSAMDG